MRELLQQMPLLRTLDDEDLDAVLAHTVAVNLADGEQLAAEDDVSDCAYIVTRGEVELVGGVGENELILSRRREGDLLDEMSVLRASARTSSIRARGAATVLVVSKGSVDRVIRSSSTALGRIFDALVVQLDQIETQSRNNPEMMELGHHTAGLAHELNNPLASVNRWVSVLHGTVEAYGGAMAGLGGLRLSPADARSIDGILAQAHDIESCGDPDPLVLGDREQQLEDWLRDHHVRDAAKSAGVLAAADGVLEDLDRLSIGGDDLSVVVSACRSTFDVHQLMAQLEIGGRRAAEIVAAIKSYSHLESSRVSDVDLRQGLDQALAILRPKLRDITVRREYEEDLPAVDTYGSSLLHVWTNLLDNAADALTESATPDAEIVVGARSSGDEVIVEIRDNGPGIPAEVGVRVFERFFTTKPPGVGTGMGLHLSRDIVVARHGGEFDVSSVPGRTAFHVRIPRSSR